MEEKYKGYKDKEKRKLYKLNYMRKYQKEWRKKNPDRARKIYANYHNNLRKKVIDMLGGPKCNNCGCNIYEILEINHIEGGGRKELRTGKYISKYLRNILQGKVNIEKYNILCRVCNTVHYVEEILGIKGYTVKFL